MPAFNPKGAFALASICGSLLSVQAVAVPRNQAQDSAFLGVDLSIGTSNYADNQHPSKVVVTHDGFNPSWGLLHVGKRKESGPTKVEALSAPTKYAADPSLKDKHRGKHVSGQHHKSSHKSKATHKNDSHKNHHPNSHRNPTKHSRSEQHHHHHHHHHHDRRALIATHVMPKYIVSGEGGIIVISGTGLPGSVLKRHVSGTHIAREHHHHHKHVHIHKHIRKRIESKDVEGTVDIRAFLGGHKLASLVIGADPLTRASFVFSATNMSATPMYLRVNPHAPPISGNPDTKTVSLRMPIFQRNNVSTVDYCAQFDPQPTKPSPLTAEPCVANSTLHSSQEFAYTPSTGTVRPLWSSATFPADSPPLERSVNCEGPPSVQFNNMNATKPDNTTSVINPSAIVRNVTLYFTALDVAGEVYALEEPIFDSDSNNTRNDASYSPTPTSFANVPTSSMAHNYATNQGSYAQLPQPLNPVASSLPAITLEQAPTSGTTPLPTVTPAVASSIPTIPAVSAYEWMFTPDE